MKNFNDMTAFITGGGSGTGLGMAKTVLDRGMRVIMPDLLGNHLEQARQELRRTIEGGIDRFERGKQVAEANAYNRPYIFLRGEFRENVVAYIAAMLKSFPTELAIDDRRRANEERRAWMTAERKARPDSLGRD